MRINRISTKRSKKILLIVAMCVLVACVGYTVYANLSHTWPFSQTNSAEMDGSSSSKIDQTPATDKDQAAANQHKQQEYEDNQVQTSPTTEKQQVQVNITTYAQKDAEVRINGYASGIVEDGGTCTLTLTDKSGTSVSRSHVAKSNATNTTCGQSVIPISALHSGTWTASLSYSSNAAEGSTQPDAIPPIEVK